MSLVLNKLLPDEWAKIAANAHLAAFGEERDPAADRSDFTLLVHDGDKPCGYATVIETEKDMAYMQFGGAFPGTEKSISAVRCYFMMVNYLKENYKIIHTHIRNYNLPMLKLAMSAGLLIVGVQAHNAETSLILSWQRAA